MFVYRWHAHLPIMDNAAWFTYATTGAKETCVRYFSSIRVRGLPSHLAIRCPRCGREADFRFPFSHGALEEIDRRRAENIRLTPFAAIPLAEVERRVATGTIRGVVERDALWGHVIVRFPQEFPLDWKPRPDWRPGTDPPGTGWGMCLCPSCGYRHRCEIRWPDDGYFTLKMRKDIPSTYRENVLWAFTRGHAVALHSYFATNGQNVGEWPAYEDYLSHVPRVFLRAKNRENVMRQLDRLLRG